MWKWQKVQKLLWQIASEMDKTNGGFGYGNNK